MFLGIRTRIVIPEEIQRSDWAGDGGIVVAGIWVQQDSTAKPDIKATVLISTSNSITMDVKVKFHANVLKKDQ